MLVLRRVIEKYGLFKMLYTDNASLFNLSILDIKNGHIKFIEEKWDFTRITRINRDTGQVQEDRTKPSVFKELPKDINLDDIFCLKEVSKVDKTNSFSYNGKIYTLDHKNNLVGRRVKLHIHPERKIRVWCNEKFIEELKWWHSIFYNSDILSLGLQKTWQKKKI